jgi:DNA-directed RNA polymerase III subunit RPC4
VDLSYYFLLPEAQIKKFIEEAMDVEEVDLANALDLSESEEEEELEDLIDDFALQGEADQDADVRQERLYFFQFPEPFPTFVPNIPSTSPTTMSVDEPPSDSRPRKVSFAADVKPPGPSGDPAGASTGPEAEQTKESTIDGVIGQLEVYRSGAVKMRLSNGILMDVTGATQPSFLQQAVHLDLQNKRLHIMGEVNKRFVVSPDIDTLLHAMELRDQAEANAMPIDDTNLIKMN